MAGFAVTQATVKTQQLFKSTEESCFACLPFLWLFSLYSKEFGQNITTLWSTLQVSAVSSHLIWKRAASSKSARWPGKCLLSRILRVLLAQYSWFKRGDKEPAPPAPDHDAGGTPRLGLTAPGRAPELEKPLSWYWPRSPEPPVEQDSRRRVSSPLSGHTASPSPSQLPGDQQRSTSIFIA